MQEMTSPFDVRRKASNVLQFVLQRRINLHLIHKYYPTEHHALYTLEFATPIATKQCDALFGSSLK